MLVKLRYVPALKARHRFLFGVRQLAGSSDPILCSAIQDHHQILSLGQLQIIEYHLSVQSNSKSLAVGNHFVAVRIQFFPAVITEGRGCQVDMTAGRTNLSICKSHRKPPRSQIGMRGHSITDCQSGKYALVLIPSWVVIPMQRSQGRVAKKG